MKLFLIIYNNNNIYIYIIKKLFIDNNKNIKYIICQLINNSLLLK